MPTHTWRPAGAQAARTGARAVLAATAAAAIRCNRLDVAAAHGDLHLAHVLLDGEQVRFVDVAQPEPYGSPADDAAALRRAVECMALDVVVDRAAAKWYPARRPRSSTNW